MRLRSAPWVRRLRLSSAEASSSFGCVKLYCTSFGCKCQVPAVLFGVFLFWGPFFCQGYYILLYTTGLVFLVRL